MFLSNGMDSCLVPGEHRGNLHEYTAKKVAESDGTPVKDGEETTVFICEGHYPDPEDPTFSKCECRLCIARRQISRSGNGR